MMWLDFKIFGSGYGLGQPFFDGPFYWLVDTSGKARSGKNGRFYHWIGGFGAQLSSFEWITPKPGTRRRLAGRDFIVFQARRQGLRVECSWACLYVKTIEQIRELKSAVCESRS